MIHEREQQIDLSQKKNNETKKRNVNARINDYDNNTGKDGHKNGNNMQNLITIQHDHMTQACLRTIRNTYDTNDTKE